MNNDDQAALDAVMNFLDRYLTPTRTSGNQMVRVSSSLIACSSC